MKKEVLIVWIQKAKNEELTTTKMAVANSSSFVIQSSFKR